MWGRTVDWATEEKIEMERKRMGKLSKQQDGEDSGSVMQRQQRKEEGEKKDPDLVGWAVGGGRRAGSVFCLVLAVRPGWSGSEAPSLGSGPGGKSIRAPGGGDVPHSAIW